MKTFISRTVIVFYLLVVSAAYTAHSHADTGSGKAKFTKHFNESLFKITDNGMFSIEILLDEKEYKIGKNVIGIVIHNAHDEDVEGADLKIISLLPKGQVNTESPVVKDKGGGLYTVSNMNINKEGHWELKISIKKKKMEDSAVFSFPDALKLRKQAGKYEAGSK
ncbi:MAG: FixH family protein [Nitrospinae bacterium]|nr:FixH family protein [Nitrospinota bacterium]